MGGRAVWVWESRSSPVSIWWRANQMRPVDFGWLPSSPPPQADRDLGCWNTARWLDSDSAVEFVRMPMLVWLTYGNVWDMAKFCWNGKSNSTNHTARRFLKDSSEFPLTYLDQMVNLFDNRPTVTTWQPWQFQMIMISPWLPWAFTVHGWISAFGPFLRALLATQGWHQTSELWWCGNSMQYTYIVFSIFLAFPLRDLLYSCWCHNVLTWFVSNCGWSGTLMLFLPINSAFAQLLVHLKHFPMIMLRPWETTGSGKAS